MNKKIELYLLVDHSHSTSAFIDKINTSIKKTIESLKFQHQTGELYGFDVDFVFIPFNHNYEVYGPTPIDKVEIADLEASGATDIGSPLIKAVDMANEHYCNFRAKARPALHPIIFLFTDGVPDAGVGCTSEEQKKYDMLFEKAAGKIKEDEGTKLSFVACSFQGYDVDSQIYKENTAKIRKLTNYRDRVIEISKYKSGENPIAKFFEEYLVQLFISTTIGTTDGIMRDGVEAFS